MSDDKALRLADEICDYSRRGHESEDAAKIRRMNSHAKAAAELRRLHSVNAELLGALRLAQSIIGHPDDAHSKLIDAAIAKAEGK